MRLIAEGKSSKEIAVSLGISVKTVDTHRSNLLRKLKVHSVAEVVRYAIRHGLVECEESSYDNRAQLGAACAGKQTQRPA